MADRLENSSQCDERARAWPFVSVIVITYDREQVLYDTISRLLEQDYAEYEVVVVDQTEQVSESTQKFFAGLDDKRVRYVHIDEVGLPNARSATCYDADFISKGMGHVHGLQSLKRKADHKF